MTRSKSFAPWLLAAAATAGALAPRPAAAAGFDTPILYSARHQAMGGTAIASVSDPSAGFHNPAGLRGVKGLAFIGDFSMILGRVRATPDVDFSGNLRSNTVVAPFFLLGGAYRVHEWVTLGVAAFPVASGGAEYRYNAGSQPWIDRTEIVFFEATPMLSVNVPKNRLLPGKLSFGAGYRFSYVTFDREKGPPDNPVFLNLKLKGTDFGGVRFGVQYQPIEPLKLGVVYRNKVVVPTEADSVTVGATQATDASLDFVLPAKLGFGARVDWERLGLATDVEWALQSQNTRPSLRGTLQTDDGPMPQTVPNVFDWQNGVTLRYGAEYRVGREQELPLRVGYIYDSKVTNPRYPSAFGTPPSATHTVTAGVGYRRETWQVNAAFTRRMGSAEVVATDNVSCAFCGYPGKYEVTMTGFYVDASVDLPL